MTGTPVENRLADLWSIMEFANPGLLGPAATFKKRYAEPIERHGDDEAAERLRRFTGPFILRRVKTDKSIISDLPDKLEMEVLCNLTAEQAALYQAVVDDMLRADRARREGIERRGLVLATMTKLKQVCNHPAHFLRDGSRLAGRSGKLDRLEEILDEVLAVGREGAAVHPVRRVRRACCAATWPPGSAARCCSCTAVCPKPERDAMVARFQADDAGAPPLFVLSLKAGGTGLTLTAANHVVHVDRWWNPAVEDQATDRAFRIGQTTNGAGPQVRLRRHGRGEDRRDDRRQARAGGPDRRHRRAVAHRAVHRPAGRAVPARGRGGGRVSELVRTGIPPSRPRAVEGGLKARSGRGAIGASWWSRRFLDVLESFAMGSRLTRGRTYARKGQVISLEVTPGEVRARCRARGRGRTDVAIGLAAVHRAGLGQGRDRAGRAGAAQRQAARRRDAARARGDLRRGRARRCSRARSTSWTSTAAARTGRCRASTSPRRSTCWPRRSTTTRS